MMSEMQGAGGMPNLGALQGMMGGDGPGVGAPSSSGGGEAKKKDKKKKVKG